MIRKLTVLMIVFFLALISNNVYSQISINGRVTDEQKSPLPYANVKLTNLTDSLQYVVLTDVNGLFTIEKINRGNYNILISYIGYKSLNTDIYINTSQTLNAFELTPDVKALEGVTIQGTIPQITFKNNQYIVNIENSIASTGLNAGDLLSLAPGVWISEAGDITINGLRGATILHDGKEIKLSGQVLSEYLKSIKSENISKIEVMPQTMSEHEAQGLGGLINIVSKTKKETGLSLLSSLTFYKQKYQGVSPNISLDYNKGKFGLQIITTGEFSKWLLKKNEERYIYNTQTFKSLNVDTIRDNNFSITSNLFYDISSKHNIGARLYFLQFNKNEKMVGNSLFWDENSLLNTNSSHPEKQNMNSYAITFNYRWKIDNEGKNLTILTDFMNQYKYDIKDWYYYITTDLNANISTFENYKSLRDRPYDIYSIKADYTHPINKTIVFKSGYKFSSSRINDKMQTDTLNNNLWIPLHGRSYDFKYNEDIHSGYLSLNIPVNNFNFYLGLRGEYTKYKLSESHNYHNFFPALSISYKINNSDISISYNKRIQRVGYFRLVPNVYYASKYSIIEGNPNLKPEIIHNIRLGYGLKNRYFFSLNYSHNNNKITQFLKQQTNDQILLTSYLDGGKENLLSANIYVPIKFFNWWESVNQISVYNKHFTHNGNSIDNTYFDFFTRHFWNVKKQLKFELLYRYTSKSKFGYQAYDPYHLLNFSIQKQFPKQSLSLKLDIQKIIYNQKQTLITQNNNIKNVSQSYYNNIPFFSLTISYKFNSGKSKRNSIERSNQDELQRVY